MCYEYLSLWMLYTDILFSIHNREMLHSCAELSNVAATPLAHARAFAARLLLRMRPTLVGNP